MIVCRSWRTTAKQLFPLVLFFGPADNHARHDEIIIAFVFKASLFTAKRTSVEIIITFVLTRLTAAFFDEAIILLDSV